MNIFLLTSLVTCFAGPGLKHGIEVELTQRVPSVIASCTYSENEPVKNADIVVYAPGEDRGEYQRGRTDANGIFAFVPDEPGQWRLVVDDGQGHREEATLLLEHDFFQSGMVASGSGTDTGSGRIGFEDIPMWLRALWGVSLMFCMASIIYLMKIRRLMRSRNDRR